MAAILVGSSDGKLFIFMSPRNSAKVGIVARVGQNKFLAANIFGRTFYRTEVEDTTVGAKKYR